MQLHYIDSGKGAPVLVFLHYFGGAGNSWNGVVSLLHDTFRCIAIDLFGFGKSPTSISQITVEESGKKLIELLEYLSLDNYVIVAHSMGAKIALDVASRGVKGLQSLILIAPSPPSPEPMTDKDRKDMYDTFGKRSEVEKMLKNALGSEIPDSIFEGEVNNNLAVSEAAWKSWPELGSKENISSQMTSVHVPISILYGEKDKRFTKEYLDKEYSQYFKTFSLSEVKNAGHLVPIEAPGKVAEELQKLLR